jgi:hypothetical protein
MPVTVLHPFLHANNAGQEYWLSFDAMLEVTECFNNVACCMSMRSYDIACRSTESWHDTIRLFAITTCYNVAGVDARRKSEALNAAPPLPLANAQTAHSLQPANTGMR